MKIGLIDVDGHNFPNLPLMKISAYHKSRGDSVEMCEPMKRYDVCYQSKVFGEDISPDIEWIPQADMIIKGGTGYGLQSKLPSLIEHMMPDYSIYGIEDTAYGFLTRGCPRNCAFCIVSEKEGLHSYKVADLDEFWDGQRNIVIMDPNLLACADHMELLEELARSKAYVDINQGLDIRLVDLPEIEVINQIKQKRIHFAWDNPEDDLEDKFRLYSEYGRKVKGKYGTVYVLTNFGSTIDQDMYRVETLDALGYDPYVMIFDKRHADKKHKDFARWVNAKMIFRSCSFEEYGRKNGTENV